MLLLEDVVDTVGRRINKKEKKEDCDGQRAESTPAKRFFGDLHFQGGRLEKYIEGRRAGQWRYEDLD